MAQCATLAARTSVLRCTEESTIATTSASHAIAALDALALSGVRFAILHGEAGIAAGSVTSDVDAVVDAHPLAVLRRAQPYLTKAGLYGIIFWPYDVGSTGTLFLSTLDASQGVQLDFLNDPAGLGIDGIRSKVLLDGCIPGTRWPSISPEHELLYLIRKRDRKSNRSALEGLLTEARRSTATQLRSQIKTAFRPDVANRVAELIEGRDTRQRPSLPPGHRSRELRRWISRATEPVGVWAEIRDPFANTIAGELAARLGRFLPYAAYGRRDSRYPVGWWSRQVAPTRFRAGAFISWGTGRSRPAPDVIVSDSTLDVAGAASQLVVALSGRLTMRCGARTSSSGPVEGSL